MPNQFFIESGYNETYDFYNVVLNLFNSKRRPCGNHFYIFNVVRNEFECNTYVFY